MKRILFSAIMLIALLSGVTSCDGVTKSISGLDYQFLSKPEEVNKWLDEVKAKAGENAKVMDEIDFNIYRPSVEGRNRSKERDHLFLTVIYQDPADKRRVEEISYQGNLSGWRRPEKKEIQVIGIGAENFRLEDELFDFNQLSYETINKVIQDALTKHKDEAKYEYQYVKGLEIKKDEIEVQIFGKIQANGVEKSELYRADFQGNSIK